MKNQFLTILFVTFTINSFAQSKTSKLKIYGGFGFQQYSGDLGNGFYQFGEAKYGAGSLGVDYALNKSFEIRAFSTLGDLGYCQPKEIRNHYAEAEHAHGKRPENENLNSRMVSGIIAVKYKFANDYFLPETNRLSPFIYAGVGINRITDIMKMECVVPGTYYSLNMGAGFEYRLTKSMYVGCTLSFGRFTSDGLDYVVRNSNDMYMQNSALIGFYL